MNQKLQVFVLADGEKCVGCKACEIACFTEHNQKENGVGQTVGTVSIPVMPKLYVTKEKELCMPIQCRHCEDAPCLEACTLHAIRKEADGVMISQDQCTGCKDCLMACPFGAIELYPVIKKGEFIMQADSDEIKQAASKCDMCMDNPMGPACVRACKAEALRIVHVEPEQEVKRIKAARILEQLKD